MDPKIANGSINLQPILYQFKSRITIFTCGQQLEFQYPIIDYFFVVVTTPLMGNFYSSSFSRAIRSLVFQQYQPKTVPQATHLASQCEREGLCASSFLYLKRKTSSGSFRRGDEWISVLNTEKYLLPAPLTIRIAKSQQDVYQSIFTNEI
jgi:hypothetical protein